MPELLFFIIIVSSLFSSCALKGKKQRHMSVYTLYLPFISPVSSSSFTVMPEMTM